MQAMNNMILAWCWWMLYNSNSIFRRLQVPCQDYPNKAKLHCFFNGGLAMTKKDDLPSISILKKMTSDERNKYLNQKLRETVAFAYEKAPDNKSQT